MFPSLFFCVDKAHSHDLAEVMRGHDVKVYPLTESTPKDQRARMVRLFREGAIDGLAACGILNEGFDAPTAVGGFLCRPTKSGLLYRQMVGRILRPFPAPTGERAYQKAALHGIWNHLKQGVINQLVVLPTGTGKTFVASQIPRIIDHWKRDHGKRGRLLFLVHREELVIQTADTFREHTSLSVGIEKADSYAGDADVVVGSVQTLGPAKYEELGHSEGRWEYNPRLLAMDPSRFDCVVVDEGHHAVKGKFYHQILRRMHALKGEEDRDPEMLMVALTATPNRSDNIGMEAVCDALVYEYGLREATKDGYLCPLRAFRCETTVDLSALKTRLGDFEAEALAKAVNTPERNELVAREYLRVRDSIQPEFESNVGRKPFACLVDFVDNTGRHPLLSAAQLYGLREKFNPKGKDILEQAEEIEEIETANPGLDLKEAADMEDVRRRVEAYKTHLHRVDLLAPAAAGSPLHKISKFLWMADGPEEYRLPLIDHAMLTIRQTALGAYEISRHMRGVRTILYVARSLPEAVKQAETEIPSGDKKLLSANAGWRKEPPTEKQIRRLIMVDRKISAAFGRSSAKLYEHAVERHAAGDDRWSRGGVANLITKADMDRR